MRVWLKQLRKQRGYSARALAQAVGVSKEIVYRWESGATNPTDENKAALASVLGEDVYQHFETELRRLAATLGLQVDCSTPSEGAV